MKPELRAEAEAVLSGWGVLLDAKAWGLLDNYLVDVLEYSRRVNITAAEGEEELVRRHLLDSFAGVNALRGRLGPTPRLADLGAGGGFLGFCVKIAWPEAEVTLIESVYRKYRFLNVAALHLGVPGLRVVHERIEPRRVRTPGAARYDAVIARAVAPLPELARLALPMAPLLAAWTSAAPAPGDAALEKALSPHAAAVLEDRAYRLPGEERERHVVLVGAKSPAERGNA